MEPEQKIKMPVATLLKANEGQLKCIHVFISEGKLWRIDPSEAAKIVACSGRPFPPVSAMTSLDRGSRLSLILEIDQACHDSKQLQAFSTTWINMFSFQLKWVWVWVLCHSNRILRQNLVLLMFNKTIKQKQNVRLVANIINKPEKFKSTLLQIMLFHWI